MQTAADDGDDLGTFTFSNAKMLLQYNTHNSYYT